MTRIERAGEVVGRLVEEYLAACERLDRLNRAALSEA
jgi:hypothetical protein